MYCDFSAHTQCRFRCSLGLRRRRLCVCLGHESGGGQIQDQHAQRKHAGEKNCQPQHILVHRTEFPPAVAHLRGETGFIAVVWAKRQTFVNWKTARARKIIFPGRPRPLQGN